MPTIQRPVALVSALVLSATLAACGHNRPAAQPYYGGGYNTTPAPSYPSNPAGTEFGRVTSIEAVQGGQQSGRTSGAGAVLGAVVGGILGNQVGGGTGRAAATAVGVLGGAVAGNAIEGNSQRGGYAQAYRLSVQLDHGGYRVYDVSSPGDLRIGDRVRLYNGQISKL